MLEPVQGEGGVRCPDPEYLRAVRQICDDAGILLIFDEIQVGMGRTGKMFGIEHFNVDPDIMFLGKPFANGISIAGIMAKKDIMKKALDNTNWNRME